MGYPAISTAISAQRAAGILKAYIKTGSEKWQSLGHIRNGEMKLTPNSGNDAARKNLAADSYIFEAKFEIMQTAILEIEKMDSICDGSNSFLFKLTDAGTISSGATEGWFTVSNSQVGAKARYVCDGNPSSQQFIEVMLKGTILKTAVDAAAKASIAVADFHISTTASETYSTNNGSAGGTIFGYYVSTTPDDNYGLNANIRSCGFSSVALQDAADTGSGYTTLGRVRNGRITIDMITEEDNLNRYNPYGVDIDIEYELLVSDATTLLLLDSMNATNTDVKVTLLDGKIWTIQHNAGALAQSLGATMTLEAVGDFDKFRIIRCSHKGRITSGTLDGLIA
jgi:hypothetical protein